MDIASILATKGDKAHTVRPEQSIRDALALLAQHNVGALIAVDDAGRPVGILSERDVVREAADRKSTRLNSSHANSSYAVFCLKKKTSAPVTPQRWKRRQSAAGPSSVSTGILAAH